MFEPSTIPAENHTLSAFREEPTAILEQVKATHRPVTLTVDGQPEFVLQEASEYDRLLDLLDAADTRAAIAEGRAQMAAGLGRPANEFLDEFRAKNDLPR